MSDRSKPHKGRDLDGRYRVRQADVEELLEDPNGVDYVRDDVRLGGAVADIGPYAGKRAERIGELVERNRDDVDRLVRPRPENGRRTRNDGRRRRDERR